MSRLLAVLCLPGKLLLNRGHNCFLTARKTASKEKKFSIFLANCRGKEEENIVLRTQQMLTNLFDSLIKYNEKFYNYNSWPQPLFLITLENSGICRNWKVNNERHHKNSLTGRDCKSPKKGVLTWEIQQGPEPCLQPLAQRLMPSACHTCRC